jgi:hypothetical protein
MQIKRVIYFIYYLKTLDKVRFNKFLRVAKVCTHKTYLLLCLDIFYSSFRYNISILDYFYFRFFKLNNKERGTWAGTGYMYEYQSRMNPKPEREVLENKIKFLAHFSYFIKRDFADISQLTQDNRIINRLLKNKSNRLVMKRSHGQAGKDVEVVKCSEYTPQELFQTMKDKSYDLLEEYVIQHPALMELSPSGLNTIRIFTQLNANEVNFLGARLRVSINSTVDNLAAGNIAAPIDMKTGIVNGPGVYSDITRNDESVHPVTKQSIVNFQVPHWEEVLTMAEQAAIFCPENRSVGWDIAVTSNGPELIEGNHNWCKLLWQMPVKKGLKKELEKYL